MMNFIRDLFFKKYLEQIRAIHKLEIQGYKREIKYLEDYVKHCQKDDSVENGLQEEIIVLQEQIKNLQLYESFFNESTDYDRHAVITSYEGQIEVISLLTLHSIVTGRAKISFNTPLRKIVDIKAIKTDQRTDQRTNNYKREVIRLNNAVNFYKKKASQTKDEEGLQEEILYLSGVIAEQREYIATLEKNGKGE